MNKMHKYYRKYFRAIYDFVRELPSASSYAMRR